MHQHTFNLDALGHHLEAHHPVVVVVPLLQPLSVVVEHKGEVVVQVELKIDKGKTINTWGVMMLIQCPHIKCSHAFDHQQPNDK